MKNLITYLSESRGQAISNREDNRPYDTTKEFIDKKELRIYKTTAYKLKKFVKGIVNMSVKDNNGYKYTFDKWLQVKIGLYDDSNFIPMFRKNSSSDDDVNQRMRNCETNNYNILDYEDSYDYQVVRTIEGDYALRFWGFKFPDDTYSLVYLDKKNNLYVKESDGNIRKLYWTFDIGSSDTRDTKRFALAFCSQLFKKKITNIDDAYIYINDIINGKYTVDDFKKAFTNIVNKWK